MIWVKEFPVTQSTSKSCDINANVMSKIQVKERKSAKNINVT
jgi:hypothetical protein